MRATLLVLLLAAAPVLAGCLSATPGATAPLPDAQQTLGNVTTVGILHGPNASALAAGLTMAPAIGGAFHVGGYTGEPSMGVDKKGNLYVAGMLPADPTVAAAAPDGGGTVYMSSDKGQTWKDVGSRIPGAAIPTHTVSFDPYLHVDVATGRVFHDDIWPLGCGSLSYSDDQGKTWTDNPASCGNPQVNDHQSITTAKPRMLPTQTYPDVVYRCVNNVGDAACATSLDGGLTFNPQILAMPGTELSAGDSPQPVVCGGLTGHVASAPDGTVYLPRGGCGWAEVAVTQDDGLTWTTHVIDRERVPDDHEVRIAVDEKNTVYATWNGEGKVWLSYSSDSGSKWSKPIDVTGPGITGTAFNAVAAGAPGRVAIAYIGTTFKDGYDNKTKADDWKGATWNAYLTIVTNASSDEPVLQSVTANDPSDPIARDQCGQTRCNGMYDFIDVWIDQEGRPWASFQDVCTHACITDPAKRFDQPEGLVASLLSGPALRGTSEVLPVIQPQLKDPGAK